MSSAKSYFNLLAVIATVSTQSFATDTDWIPKNGEKIVVKTQSDQVYYAIAKGYFPSGQTVSYEATGPWGPDIIGVFKSIQDTLLADAAKTFGCTKDGTICVGYKTTVKNGYSVEEGKVVGIFTDGSIAVEVVLTQGSWNSQELKTFKKIYKSPQADVAVTEHNRGPCTLL